MPKLWRTKKDVPKFYTCKFCQKAIVKEEKHSGEFYSVASSGEKGADKIHTVSVPNASTHTVLTLKSTGIRVALALPIELGVGKERRTLFGSWGYLIR